MGRYRTRDVTHANWNPIQTVAATIKIDGVRALKLPVAANAAPKNKLTTSTMLMYSDLAIRIRKVTAEIRNSTTAYPMIQMTQLPTVFIVPPPAANAVHH